MQKKDKQDMLARVWKTFLKLFQDILKNTEFQFQTSKTSSSFQNFSQVFFLNFCSPFSKKIQNIFKIQTLNCLIRNLFVSKLSNFESLKFKFKFNLSLNYLNFLFEIVQF